MMFSPIRITSIAVAVVGIFAHQDEILVKWTASEWSEWSRKFNEREGERDRRQRELRFLQAAYDRLQADLNEDPARRGAQSIRGEQEIILKMMRETTTEPIAASQTSPNTGNQAKAEQVPITDDPSKTLVVTGSASGAPIAVAPIPPREPAALNLPDE
jgi:hypothetical protein